MTEQTLSIRYRPQSIIPLPTIPDTDQEDRLQHEWQLTQQRLLEALQRDLRHQMWQRLQNWGMWWWHGNQLQIRHDTGYRSESLSSRLIRYAPVQSASGYARQHTQPPDEQDAESLHLSIVRLPAHYRAEIVRFYAERNGAGTPAQRKMRGRAVDELIKIVAA